MAQSVIEDRLKQPQPSSFIEPQLRDFALKLGYSNQVIDQAVQKLGSNVTQNTLLNELLKTTASLPYQISAVPSQPKPPPAPMAAYQRPREVVARGATSIGPSRFENPPMHQHWDREPSPGPLSLYPMRDANPRGTPVIPRPSYEMLGELIERGAPRGTKRGYEVQRPADVIARGAPADVIARGAPSVVKPLMPVSYGNQASPVYDVSREAASGSGISASERLDEQEQLMYQQILGAKKAAGNAYSYLRPVVIDGSNVAMR